MAWCINQLIRFALNVCPLLSGAMVSRPSNIIALKNAVSSSAKAADKPIRFAIPDRIGHYGATIRIYRCSYRELRCSEVVSEYESIRFSATNYVSLDHLNLCSDSWRHQMPQTADRVPGSSQNAVGYFCVLNPIPLPAIWHVAQLLPLVPRLWKKGVFSTIGPAV